MEGVPFIAGIWNVDWLGDEIGYLDGTAFPTWSGNSVLTGHVVGFNGQPGPFVDLDTLTWGDKIIIETPDQRAEYEVRQVAYVEPDDLSVLRHEEAPWITLITCRNYDEKSNKYDLRVVVKAFNVKITPIQ